MRGRWGRAAHGEAMMAHVGAHKRPHPFLIGVSLYDTTLVSYGFDQDRVVIGRGDDVDLQLMHAAVARRQLTIERIVPPIGQPRFRIVPHQPSRNPVLLNGAPAVEEAIGFGDVVAIGETRLVLLPQPKPKGRLLSPLRVAIGMVVLVALGALLLPLVVTPARESAPPLVNDKLFAHLPTVSCADARQCSERARVAYAHGKTYARQGTSVPGNWYRAAVEFYRAAEFERLSGAPIPGLEDTHDRLAFCAGTADTIFNDLQFRLARQLQENDVPALHRTIEALAAMVPDEDHPIHARLAEYLRTHPLPKDKGASK
jgi:hypothetical protein